MADVVKDSYSEALQQTKVLFQRGRDVIDFELNELQDILRVVAFRQFLNGIQKQNGSYLLNPGSNDDGYLVVGTSANNSVTLKAGVLFCDGFPIILGSDATFSGFTTAGAPRTDTVYLSVFESEVADPAQVSQLGETTKRRKLTITVNVSITGLAGVPSNSSLEIFQGGVHYFAIANVTRRNGDPQILSTDVVDLRGVLPPSFIKNLQLQTSGKGSTLVGSQAITYGTFPLAASPASGGFFQLAIGTVYDQLAELIGWFNYFATITPISANYTIDSGGIRDRTLTIQSAGPFNIQLPMPSRNTGREIIICDNFGNLSPTSAVTLVRFGSEKIENFAGNYALIVTGGRWVLRCDGTNWYLW